MDSDFAERYLKRVQEIIERSGWVVQYVAGTPDDPVSFAYTIGLKSTLGHRELFIVGFEQQMSLDILNAAGNAIRDGARFDQDTLSDRIIQDYPAAVRPVDTDKAQEVGRIADVYYGDAGFEAAQVFLPDASGMFPWDASCDPKCAAMQTAIFPETKVTSPALKRH